MNPRLAVDTSAAVDYVRNDRMSPPQLTTTRDVALPITVLGELFYGAFHSRNVSGNRAVVESLVREWTLLLIDSDTARIYGQVRASIFGASTSLKASKVNDLWIAALCLQHDLPLLTNDGGFGHIPSLRVLHW